MPNANVIKHLHDGLDVDSRSHIEIYVYLLNVEPVAQRAPSIPWDLSVVISDGKYAMHALLVPELSGRARGFDLPTTVRVRALSMAAFSGSRVYILEDVVECKSALEGDLSDLAYVNTIQDIDSVCGAVLQREGAIGELLKVLPAYEMAEELVILRERNKCLKETLLETKQRYKVKVGRHCEVVDTLITEVEALKSALRAKDELLETLVAERRTRIGLPFELWRMIFHSALPPREHVEVMMAAPIRRMRIESFALLKSVVRVNKLWHAVGTELLYERVYVEHVGHIASLASSLESSAARGDNFGHYVKLISIDFWHPPECNDIFAHDLNAVASLCPHIQGLIVGPKTLGLDPDYPGQASHWIPRSLFYSVAGRLKQVSILQDEGDSSQISEWLYGLLDACHNLVRLDLILDCTQRTSPEPHARVNISFGRLKHLRVGIDCDELLTIVSAWDMPALTTLIIHSGRHASTSRYLLFVQKNGKRLIRLDLRLKDGHDPEIHDSQTLQPFLDECPILEHLCYIRLHHTTILDDLTLNHRTLAYVDEWTGSRNAFLPVLGGPLIRNHPGLPALVRHRVLDWDLNRIPDLPLLLPPQKIPEERLVVHNILGLEIVEGPRGVFIHGGTLWQDEDGNWSEQTNYERNIIIAPSLTYGEWPWDGVSDSTDSSYEPGLSVYSSEWDFDRDYESLDPLKDDADSIEQLDRQTILENYRASMHHSDHVRA